MFQGNTRQLGNYVNAHMTKTKHVLKHLLIPKHKIISDLKQCNTQCLSLSRNSKYTQNPGRHLSQYKWTQNKLFEVTVSVFLSNMHSRNSFTIHQYFIPYLLHFNTIPQEFFKEMFFKSVTAISKWKLF